MNSVDRGRPVGIGEGGLQLPEQVEQRDDRDQRGVLEQRDEAVDETRDDVAQRLRHHDQPGRLPERQPERACRFPLPARDCRQAAADHLGLIGAGKQRDADQRAHEAIDREIAGQEQRQHVGGKEQHRDQRHAAPELDEGDGEDADQRNGRTPPERQRNADRHRGDDARHRHHQRHQQAAPQPRINDRQAATVETQDRDDDADTGEDDEARDQRASAGAQPPPSQNISPETITAVATRSAQTGRPNDWMRSRSQVSGHRDPRDHRAEQHEQLANQPQQRPDCGGRTQRDELVAALADAAVEGRTGRWRSS